MESIATLHRSVEYIYLVHEWSWLGSMVEYFATFLCGYEVNHALKNELDIYTISNESNTISLVMLFKVCFPFKHYVKHSVYNMT